MKHLALILALMSVCIGAVAGEPADSTALKSLQDVERRAADGDNAARFRLSRALETGYGSILQRDSVRSRRLLEQAAHAGYAPALNYLGFIVYEEQRPDSAVNLFMAAADCGDITAYTNLGWLLLHGQGTVHDPAKALYWLGKGADKGSAAASAMLGDMYRTATGVPADTLEARHCYDRALDLYHSASYRDTRAVSDISRALISLYTAIDTLCTDSLTTIGDRYSDLHAPAVAMHFYAAAARQGNPRAQRLLAKGYAMADGIPYSHTQSLRWYLAAARGGDREAQRILGELLEITPDTLRELPPEYTDGLTEEQHTAQYWLQLCRQP